MEQILSTILGNKYDQRKIIEIWNKSDLLNKEDLVYFNNLARRKDNAILFSSKLKEGKDNFIKLINKKIKKNKKFFLFDFTRSANRKEIESLL